MPRVKRYASLFRAKNKKRRTTRRRAQAATFPISSPGDELLRGFRREFSLDNSVLVDARSMKFRDASGCPEEERGTGTLEALSKKSTAHALSAPPPVNSLYLRFLRRDCSSLNSGRSRGRGRFRAKRGERAIYLPRHSVGGCSRRVSENVIPFRCANRRNNIDKCHVGQ